MWHQVTVLYCTASHECCISGCLLHMHDIVCGFWEVFPLTCSVLAYATTYKYSGGVHLHSVWNYVSGVDYCSTIRLLHMPEFKTIYKYKMS